LLAGLAAAFHQRLGFSSDTAALEIGGACTGFLAAMWTAQRLLTDRVAVLVLAVEAPSRWLPIEPGPAGEAAALFGDATAACVLTAQSATAAAIPVRDIQLGTNGAAGSLLRVEHEPGRGVVLHMDGPPLAQRAVRAMTDAVRQMSARHGLTVEQFAAVVAHGGNGRMPALLARRLALPAERVWSETAQTGNLGSASLPVAWASHDGPVQSPVIWTAVGVGLQWGAALLEGEHQLSPRKPPREFTA
jgi:3-oxoacyl-[acyl-carrier-protein] synthase-3